MTDTRSRVVQLNERRMTVWNEAQRFLDDIQRRGGDMSAADTAQWGRYNDELTDLADEVDKVVARETREAEGAALRDTLPGVFGDARPVDHADAALRSVLRGDIDPKTGRPATLTLPLEKVAKERSLLRQGADAHEIRQLVWDTGSVGSAVPVSMARTLYEYLEASNAMFRAPTTRINTSAGEPMDFPKLTAHSIATQVSGQGTQFAGTDPTFNKVRFDAYKYGQLVRVSNEVVSDTAVDIVRFLGRDLGRALGRVIATDLVVGSGTGEPRGIMTALAGNGAGSVMTGGTAIGPSYNFLIDMQYGVVDEYRMHDSVGWLLRDSTAGTIRKLRDGAGGTVGAALWQPSLTQGISGGEPDRLLGDPVFRDSNVAAQGSNARLAAYGDFSAYYIRTVGDVVIERSDDRYFDTDEVAIRAKWRVDGDLMDYGALVTGVMNV